MYYWGVEEVMWFRWNKSDGKEKLVAQIVTGNAHLYFILNVIK